MSRRRRLLNTLDAAALLKQERQLAAQWRDAKLAQVAVVDGLLAEVRTCIGRVALGCIRGAPDAPARVARALAAVDAARTALMRVNYDDALPEAKAK